GLFWLLFSLVRYKHNMSSCKGEDRVIQPTEDVFASEGDIVTLDCTFETTRTSPTLFWYRQKCNDFPRYMLKSYSDKAEKASEFQTDRFNAKLQLTDSAVYYCALEPTVTGNTTTLESLFKHTFQSLIEISKLTFQGGAKLLLNYTKKRNFNIQHTAIHDTDTLLHSACSHCIYGSFLVLSIFNYMLTIIFLNYLIRFPFFWFRLIGLVNCSKPS
uniref:Ig-like domain-containing protein n=1 Tax=Labrus bergylta TaxID=56723 RepID=A0A3Q3M9T4_9LABR